MSGVSLGTCPRYILVADENVEKPNKQRNNKRENKSNEIVLPEADTRLFINRKAKTKQTFFSYLLRRYKLKHLSAT